MHRPGPFHEVDAPIRDYQDMRSAAKSRKRGRDQHHKYHKYGSVHRGQTQVPHYISKDRWTWPSGFDGCEIREQLSKRDFYNMAREAQICRHHQACPYKKTTNRIQEVVHRRGAQYARRQASHWTSTIHDLSSPYWNWTRDGDHDVWPLDSPDQLDSYDLIELSGFDPMDDLYDDVESSDEFEEQAEEAEKAAVSATDADDWSELESIVSWDDFLLVAPHARCSDDNESLWTEVQAI